VGLCIGISNCILLLSKCINIMLSRRFADLLAIVFACTVVISTFYFIQLLQKVTLILFKSFVSMYFIFHYVVVTCRPTFIKVKQ